MKRRIIHIDEEKCNGCGLCADACHEGAIGMIEQNCSGRIIATALETVCLPVLPGPFPLKKERRPPMMRRRLWKINRRSRAGA